METLIVSLIFFLITAGAASFPFALALWGSGAENPNVFVLSGALAMVFAAANIMLVQRRSSGKAGPRILASLGLSLAAGMVIFPLYQKWFCLVCLVTGGSHKIVPIAGVILLLFGVVIFFLGWRVTGWGVSQRAEVMESEILEEPRKGSSAT